MLSLSLPPLPHSASSPLYPEIFPLSCPLYLLRCPDPRRGGGGGGGEEEGEEGRGQRSMSAMAVSSSLNPDAPLFIPAAFRQVEDFSPQWWDLVKSTAWFRDHWFHQHQQLDDMADSLLAFEVQNDDDVASLLPDAFDDDLFYDHHQHSPVAFDVAAQQPPAALKTDAVLKAALSLTSPKGGDAPRGLREKPSPRHSEKPTKYAGSPRSGGAPRVIHQPR